MSSLAAHKEVKYGFNFDEWIVDNGLDSVKQILIQHKATTLATLKFNAVEFQSVLTDTQLLTKVHMLPTLTNAVHNISKIVVHVTDEEQQVIDCIKQNLKAMNETQQEIDTLRVEYPNSFARINASKLDQIKTAKEKVNEMFNEMFMELCEIWKGRREAILSQIESIEDNVHQNVSDSKDVDMISICSENISNCSQLLKEAERTYNTLTSTNEKRSERKAQILKVGQMITYQCTKTQNILKDNIDAINREIAANNALIIHFDFVVKGNIRNKLNEYVQKLGVIENKTYPSDQERVNESDDELIIPQLRQHTEASKPNRNVSPPRRPPPPNVIPRSYSSRVSSCNNTDSIQQSGTAAIDEQLLPTQSSHSPRQSVPALEPNHDIDSDSESDTYTSTTDNSTIRSLRPKHKYLCYQCNSKFTTQVEKDAHSTHCDEHNTCDINIDSVAYTHVCDVCHKGFSSGNALGGHRSVHKRMKRMGKMYNKASGRHESSSSSSTEDTDSSSMDASSHVAIATHNHMIINDSEYKEYEGLQNKEIMKKIIDKLCAMDEAKLCDESVAKTPPKEGDDDSKMELETLSFIVIRGKIEQDKYESVQQDFLADINKLLRSIFRAYGANDVEYQSALKLKQFAYRQCTAALGAKAPRKSQLAYEELQCLAMSKYEEISDYQFFCDDEVLREKMTCKKSVRCDGKWCHELSNLGPYCIQSQEWKSQCLCRSKQMECGDECGCDPSTCLNRCIQKKKIKLNGVSIREQEVFGIDQHTRMCLDKALPKEISEVYGDKEEGAKSYFIEKRLCPAINNFQYFVAEHAEYASSYDPKLVSKPSESE
eukprot:768032_1